jgi:hypothetical protein
MATSSVARKFSRRKVRSGDRVVRRLLDVMGARGIGYREGWRSRRETGARRKRLRWVTSDVGEGLRDAERRSRSGELMRSVIVIVLFFDDGGFFKGLGFCRELKYCLGCHSSGSRAHRPDRYNLEMICSKCDTEP